MNLKKEEENYWGKSFRKLNALQKELRETLSIILKNKHFQSKITKIEKISAIISIYTKLAKFKHLHTTKSIEVYIEFYQKASTLNFNHKKSFHEYTDIFGQYYSGQIHFFWELGDALEDLSEDPELENSQTGRQYKAIIKKLIRHSDILLENFRELGAHFIIFGYEILNTEKPLLKKETSSALDKIYKANSDFWLAGMDFNCADSDLVWMRNSIIPILDDRYDYFFNEHESFFNIPYKSPAFLED